MAQLTRAVTALVAATVALAVAVPLLIQLVNALVVPVAILGLLAMIGRLVVFYTSR